jgi:acetyl coenzyme A synthetase (ADP forming)-like protein
MKTTIVTASDDIGAAPVDVLLRDGRAVRLREPTVADADAVVAFFAQLSSESRGFRFHGAVRVVRSTVEPFLAPDWRDRGALIATGDDGDVVALASYARLNDPATAEVAFAVADRLQGDGMGTRLLERLAARARAAGIETFVAEVLSGNAPMLRVFAQAGFEVSRTREGGVVEVRFPITADDAFRARVDARDHVAVSRSLRPLFEPASIAVIGASPREGSIGGDLFRNIVGAGFRGACVPINRSGQAVAGLAAHRAVADIGAPVDLAIVCVPADQVESAAHEALAAGTRALCVISSGFAERGADGRLRQERLLALVRRYGARLVGPNCLGIAVPPIGLNATFASRALPLGTLAFASQSGALGLALLERASERGLGFSSFVSMGNKADISSNDLLEWWEDDDATHAVLLYLESFGNPRRFGRVAARVARKKPIVALKAGTSHAGSRAASSHTAALAGSESAVDALFREAGVQRVRTLEEFVDAAAYLSAQPLPLGRRVGVVTNAGGLGILCADACEAVGLSLPDLAEATRAQLAAVLPVDASLRNPIDLLGGATPETYAAALPIVLSDPAIDALIVLFVPPVVARPDDVARAICAALAGATKPVLCSIVSADQTAQALLRAAGIAEFPYPESAARALGLAAERADWLARPVGHVQVPTGIDIHAGRAIVERALEAGRSWLGQAEITALFSAFGIPLVRTEVADDVDDALAAADGVGYPVAIKTARPGVHKSREGGVALGLADATAVRAAVARIGAPVLVQGMAGGGAELLAGIVQDPVFGALVAFGIGGTLAELVASVGFRGVPLTDVSCNELVHSGTAGRLIAGVAGGPPLDGASLADLLLRLSALAEAVPEIAELDLNPVVAREHGCIALDARVRVERPGAARTAKTW